MNITRRNKYVNTGKSIIKTDQKIPIVFDLPALDLFCSYILSENRFIRNSHLLNMRNLILLLDKDLYTNDPEKMKRLDFIIRGLEGRINAKIKNQSLLLKYINGGISENNFLENGFPELTTDELNWIDETVSESLKYTFMYKKVDEIIDLCNRFKAQDYRYRGQVVEEFEILMNELHSDFRRSKTDSLSDITFTLRNGMFEEVMRDIYDQVTNPSRRLVTGMQGFNELTNGGLESGRVYLLFGTSGVGKSLTMLNIAYQIKKYNKNFKPKDPTKIPCIVLLTMENTVQETVTRLFDLTTESEDISNFSYDEVIRKLRDEGELFLTDESPIDIIIKYKPSGSVDTGYLYNMVEDLEDEGYECVLVIQDHIKKIKSIYKQSDIRIELGEVVNEFKAFAAIKDIPVLSDSHLNRDACRIIDEGSRANKQDLTRMLGRSNVGESMLMIDNCDCGFIINKDYDRDGNMYMVFSRIKFRDKSTGREYIAHPFVQGSTIKLVEDFYMPVPMFKDSLHNAPDLVDNTKIRNSAYSNIEKIDNDNIFDRMSSYASDQSDIIKNGFMPEIVGERSEPIPFSGFVYSSVDEDHIQNIEPLQKINAIEFYNPSIAFYPV